MSNLGDVADALQTVLGEEANRLARATGFIQRQRKFSGASFVQTLVFGWMANPASSLEALQQAAATVGVAVSAQAIDQRFTAEAATFLIQVLEAAVTQAITAETPVAIEVFERFSGVYLDDGSVISLPVELASVWAGCGGTNGVSAALKVQFSVDLRYGRIRGLWLRPGKEPDASSPSQAAGLPRSAVRIQDKGFHSIAVMQRLRDQHRYCLCPFKCGVNTYTAGGDPFDLVALLETQQADEVDLPIQFGARARFGCRVLAQRVSAEVAEARRARIREQARANGQSPSARALALASWTVLVTTVPPELLSVVEAMILYRVRWQIELIFKLWKSLFLVDEWRTEHPWRILCEVVAKLLVVIVQHWLVLTTCWAYADKSLMKAAATLKKFAFALARVLSRRRLLCAVLRDIKRCLASGCRVQRRKRKPATFQRLLMLSSVGGSGPGAP
jgi:hypothetical protein